MVENGYVKSEDGEAAKKQPLAVTARTTGSHIFAGEYFAEEVRREIYDRYGEKKLYEGGLSVRATLDPKLQQLARKSLTAGMIRYDENQGYRGAVQKLDISGDWGVKLAEVKALVGYRLEARGGAGNLRPVGAYRLPAAARAGRRRACANAASASCRSTA